MLLFFRIEIQYIENKCHIFEILKNKVTNKKYKYSKYVYTKVYKVLNSVITTEFMSEMKEKVPFDIKAIQTNN